MHSTDRDSSESFDGQASAEPQGNQHLIELCTSNRDASTVRQFCQQILKVGSESVVIIPPASQRDPARWLQGDSALQVTPVKNRMLIEPGRIYVVPPRRRVAIASGSFRVSVVKRDAAGEDLVEPIFKSLADMFQSSAVGVSFANEDAFVENGLSAIREVGGLALVCHAGQAPAELASQVLEFLRKQVPFGKSAQTAALESGPATPAVGALLTGGQHQRVAEDLDNLIRSTQTATIFLDNNLLIRSFTPAVTAIYPLQPNDIGRSLESIESRAHFMPPIPRPTDVSESEPEQLTIGTHDERYFVRKALPYRTNQGLLDGLVITFTDVTEFRRKEAGYRQADRQFRSITNTVPAAIAYIDINRRCQFANQKFCDWIGQPSSQIVGSLADGLMTGPFAELADCLDAALRGDRQQYEMAMPRDPEEGIRFASVTFTPDVNDQSELVGTCVLATDITELKRSNYRRKHREKRMSAILAATAEGIYGIDVDGKCTFANQAAARILGYDCPSDFIGHSMHELIHHTKVDGQPYPEHECLINQAYLRGEQVHVDTEVFWRADGASLEVEYWSYPKMIDDEILGCVVTFRDISQRRIWEREIAEQHAGLRRVIDNMLNFVGVLDPSGIMLEVNQTALNAGGLSREDVIGKPFWDCYWWSYSSRVAARLKKAVAKATGGETVRYDETVRMKNDQPMDIDFMMIPVRNDQGSITHLIPSGVDISDRKRAERKARQRERHLSLALEAGQMGTWVWDIAANRISWSDRLYEIYGFEKGEFAETPDAFLELTLPEDRPVVEEVIDSILNSDSKREDYEIRARRGTDGEIIWTKIDGVVDRDQEGNAVRVTGIASDITSRKRGEISLAFFADLVSSINDLHTPDEIIRAACSQIRKFLGLAHCLLVDIDDRAEIANVFHDEHAEHHPNIEGLYEMADFWSVEERHELREGGILVVDDTALMRDSELAASFAELDIHSLVVVGCTQEQRLTFILAAQKDERYSWRQDEIELLREIGDMLYLRIERTRAEQALRSSEEHLRRVINNQLGLVGVIGSDGLLLEVDDRSMNIAGLEREDVIGKHFAECAWWTYDDAVANRIREAMDRAFAGEKVRFDIGLFSKDGKPLMIDFMIAPVHDASGEISYLIPSGVDISDRKAAEQKLADNELRLKMAMKAAGLAAWEWTPEASFWTDELYDMIGADRNQTPSPELFFKNVHPDDVAILKDAWHRSTRRGAPYDSEFRIVRPDGQVRWIYGVGEVVRDENGEILRIFGLNWDNTAERLAAEALRESERRAQQANESKSEFLANMSHEIRTPMSAIIGYADILSGHLNDPDDLNCVSIIRNNGNFLLDIINDILDISKIEAGKLELGRKIFRLDRLLSDVQSLMLVRATEKRLAFEVSIANEIPRKIRSDSKRLKQILVNLLGNAIKFTESGSVQLSVRSERQPDETQCRTYFDVIDTGIGIESEHLTRLFDPFMQGDASVGRKFGGTGLGLAISQRLARNLDGEISVTSEPGGGSQFTLMIQSEIAKGSGFVSQSDWDQPDKAVSRRGLSPTKQTGIDGRILVVDDRREIRFIAQHFIEDAGGTVVTAENGQEAIDAVEAAEQAGQPFDLVVIDMQMPVVDGYEATRRLRASGFDKPVIALTAHAMEGDREVCLEAGCTDYLSKPLDGPLFVQKLVNYLDRDQSPNQ
ncbi:PAS domain S-box protein [Mariniblastus fucicola]|uniref:histidine kinase n=1 Tax=Mariniblastus fucicola TaxID=980251 RepID=A0A5B9PHU9_9BACT|nr:PAS domain S-box protein [Mariniblastus fucicola]QEG24246.1 Sensory/regulatory protein RpfC [Mariniblastus fucicola]